MTDWLARKQGSIIDLGLPGDSENVPSHIWLTRTQQYYVQLRQAMRMAALREAGRIKPYRAA